MVASGEGTRGAGSTSTLAPNRPDAVRASKTEHGRDSTPPWKKNTLVYKLGIQILTIHQSLQIIFKYKMKSK